MKTYEKPKLIALSISGNNMLCNTCTIDVIGDNKDDDLGDLIFDEGLFAAGDPCDVVVDFKGYCKNTPEGNIIINS